MKLNFIFNILVTSMLFIPRINAMDNSSVPCFAAWKFTDQNRQEFKNFIKWMDTKEKCGICKQAGAGDICWPSEHSRLACPTCFELIKPTQKDFIAALQAKYKCENLNKAHAIAVKAVQAAIGDSTIKDFYTKNGAEALKALFDKEGLESLQNK
jgi:hypothetical protein